ncbi:MAG: hotdog fold thioesterase [Candidatus Cyclobacteriaceae bacterium M2_1C_046]
MFDTSITVDHLNKMAKGCMLEHLGIEFIEVGKDFIKAKMPVDHRTHQPYGLLHGGASVTLAETLGSVAAHHTVNDERFYTVGQEINANHIRSIREGFVYGITKPIHIGKRSHIWSIEIFDEQDRLICISRITMAVIEKR